MTGIQIATAGIWQLHTDKLFYPLRKESFKRVVHRYSRVSVRIM